MGKIKTYAELHEFAQSLWMSIKVPIPENVVMRVELEHDQYGAMMQDCHRAVYNYPANIEVIENRSRRPSFTIKIGPSIFLVSMEEPIYDFGGI